MKVFQTIWSLFFRLFPCPTRVGLRRVGDPGPGSPVLVTCNFHLTVARVTRILRRAGVDAWLLVADSRGDNVWCSSGGGEFNNRSVASSVKTSGVEDLVDHRVLILPPLCAPGISAKKVRSQTGWFTRWGPVRAHDLPAYLARGCHREPAMKRVTWQWRERLDSALGSLFPFYFLGALGFLFISPHLLLTYLLVGAAAGIFFFLLCPWLPGKHGLTKVLFLIALLGAGLAACEALSWPQSWDPMPALIMAMALLLVYGTELGGIASTQPSDLDPFLARLGVKAIGNVALAGTARTELLNHYRRLAYDPALCDGCRCCHEVCPQGVWEIGQDKRAVFAHNEACTACLACLKQCSTGAIQAPLVSS